MNRHPLAPLAFDLPPDRCAVVAEAGQCMEGSVDRAVAMVDQAADAGAWGFKVQMLNPVDLAAPGAPLYWRDRLGRDDQRQAFFASGLVAYRSWGPVRDRCHDRGLAFIATPFDSDAVDACVELGVDAIKVASGDLTNTPLLSRCMAAAAHLGCRLIVSTGAATEDEIQHVARVLAAYRPEHAAPDVVWLACTLAYPTPDHAAHLARIPELARLVSLARYRGAVSISEARWSVGYSDHTTGTDTSLAAAAAGAVLCEKHFTDGEAHEVPDNDIALNPWDLATYVTNANRGAALRGRADLEPDPAEEAARHGARRSVHLVKHLGAGDVITDAHLAVLRPGGGLAPSVAGWLIGQRAAVAMEPGMLTETRTPVAVPTP